MSPTTSDCFPRFRPVIAAALFCVIAASSATAEQMGAPMPPAAAAEANPPAAPKAVPVMPQRRAESLGTAATVSTTVSMDVLDGNRPLARGDVLNFRIVEDKDPPVALRVNDAGNIEVPYIGTVSAAGKTPRQLAFDVKAMLEREYYHNASVIISLDTAGERSAGLFYITGAVNGGGPMETITVNVKEILEKGRQDLDVEVLPNDLIRVPERLINF
jgi:protein involved in polysaccharide export with SLBB domain